MTPLVLGIPLDLGGSLLLEAVFGVLFATAIVAWSACAHVRAGAGRSSARSCSSPTRRTRRSTTRRRATRSSPPASPAGRCSSRGRWSARPAGGSSRSARGIAGLVLIRAANEILLPLAFVPLVAAVPWRKRLVVGGLPRGRSPPARGVGGPQRRPLRLDDRTARRTGLGPVPARVHRRPHDLPGNGDASRRLGDLVERGVLRRSRTPDSGSRSMRTWRTARTTRP